MSKAFTSEDAATPEVVVPQRIKAPPPETPPVEQLREDGKVRLGARVTLEDDEGREVKYELVPSDEADPARGRVSVESPLGRALLGKEEGDEVVVERPRGPASYSVVGIRF
ncbi:MAG TPA: GreA/GreB family elongation factor [Myxococcales bacterium]